MADTELKIAEFFENENRDYEKLIRSVQLWYSYVKDNITVVSAARSAHKENKYLHDWRRSIVVQYVSNSISEPAKCTHENTFHQITDATCISYGEDALMCSDCGYVLSVAQIAKINHEYEWVNNNNQTCTSDGTRTGTCKMCNGTRIETIPDTATGHNIVWTYNEDATCLLDGTETATCRNGCNFNLTRIKEGSALGHDWSDYSWVNNVEPNCETTATKMRYCKRPACGIVESETYDKLAHSWVPNMDGTHTCINGCGVTEECDPLGPGEICDKCGYTVNVNWEVFMYNPSSDEEFNIDLYLYDHYSLIIGMNYDIPNIQYTVSSTMPGVCQMYADNGVALFPESVGTFTCTITATDPSERYFTTPVSKTYNVKVINEYEGIAVAMQGSTSTQTLSLNEPYVFTFFTTIEFPASATEITYNSNFPTGMNVTEYNMTVNGGKVCKFLELSGYPTVEGTYNFTVTYTNTGTYKYFNSISKTSTFYVVDPNATVTFICTDGTVSESSRVVTKGSLIGELPTATPSDASKIFLGWYTAALGGLKVNESYAISANITLYARFVDSNSGQDDVDVEFGEATSAFNISFNGDRTNYGNNNYTIYHKCVDGTSDSLVTQTGIWSSNGTNSMSASNPEVKFYMKVTNNGESGVFDIGYDADSYVVNYNNDTVNIKRLSDDSFAFMKDGSNDSTTAYTVTIPHPFVLWAGQYSARTSHRWDTTDVPAVGSYISGVDSGFACTIKNIYIPANSYTILEIDFKYYTGE